MDVHGVSAYHHLYPKRIVEDVAAKLEQLTPDYDRIVVLYGDCGTAGGLDEVLSRYPAARPAGVNCYEWYVGQDYQRLQDEQLGTYFLTDWLVGHWDQAVIRGLGLDRYPFLKDTYFRHLTHLLYLRQQPSDSLTDQAHEIAAYLEVPARDTRHRDAARRTGPDRGAGHVARPCTTVPSDGRPSELSS